jgi:hypothetical protein
MESHWGVRSARSPRESTLSVPKAGIIWQVGSARSATTAVLAVGSKNLEEHGTRDNLAGAGGTRGVAEKSITRKIKRRST